MRYGRSIRSTCGNGARAGRRRSRATARVADAPQVPDSSTAWSCLGPQRLHRGRVPWDPQREPEPRLLAPLYPHLPAVGEDDLARDVEAEPDSLALGSRHAEEFLEDAMPVFRRNPGALVAHLEPDLLVIRLRPDLDLAALRAVADGVGDQVLEDEPDPVRIDQHGRHRLADRLGEIDPRLPRHLDLRRDGGVRERLRRQRRERDLHLPRLDPR